MCFRTGLAACAAMLLSMRAGAAVLPLVPADTRIGLTVYAMGMFPQAGQFSRFTGTLTIDAGHLDVCHVAMQIEVASLTMSTARGTTLALGPTMLDAVHFPTLTYDGDCTPARTAGQLTLHGVTRPLVLATTRSLQGISAHGSLRRQDYAIRGFPGLVGGTIDIVFTVDLPPSLAEELPR